MSQKNSSTNRSEFVYNELSQALSSLELRPGTSLSESRVAQRLGVSRTPVREALRRLELEGMVEQPDGGTFIVRGVDLQDIDEICDVLELLDTYVVERACTRLTSGQKDEILALAEEMTDAAALGDHSRWNAADLRFHELIQEAAGNQLVHNLARQTRARVHRFWSASVRENRLVDCSVEHLDIARAITAADSDQAKLLAVGHVNHMRASLRDLVERAAPFLPPSLLSVKSALS